MSWEELLAQKELIVQMSGQHIAEKENFERNIREEQMIKDTKTTENLQKYELSKVELET